MTVETASHIDELNATYPLGGDSKSEGDNHIRLLKTVLQTDFPSITGPVTATQSELNTLDGITATTAELNILDGVTATAAEINKLDGVTATTAELNILDGVTATAAELNKLDGVTATTTEINTLDASAHAATGFTYSNRVYISSDSPCIASFDVSTVLPVDDTWYSCGPTGSGATNIFNFLDNLPTDTKWIGVLFEMHVYTEVLDSGYIYARRNGSSVAKGATTRVAGMATNVSLGTGTSIDFTTYCRIPVSSRKFDLLIDNGADIVSADFKLMDFGV